MVGLKRYPVIFNKSWSFKWLLVWFLTTFWFERQGQFMGFNKVAMVYLTQAFNNCWPHIPAYRHARIYKHVHMRTHTHTHIHMHRHTCINKRAHTYTCEHKHICTLACTHTLKYTHTHAHTNIIYIYIYIYIERERERERKRVIWRKILKMRNSKWSSLDV